MAKDVCCATRIIIKPWKPLLCSHGGQRMTGYRSIYGKGCCSLGENEADLEMQIKIVYTYIYIYINYLHIKNSIQPY